MITCNETFSFCFNVFFFLYISRLSHSLQSPPRLCIVYTAHKDLIENLWRENEWEKKKKRRKQQLNWPSYNLDCLDQISMFKVNVELFTRIILLTCIQIYDLIEHNRIFYSTIFRGLTDGLSSILFARHVENHYEDTSHHVCLKSRSSTLSLDSFVGRPWMETKEHFQMHRNLTETCKIIIKHLISCDYVLKRKIPIF